MPCELMLQDTARFLAVRAYGRQVLGPGDTGGVEMGQGKSGRVSYRHVASGELRRREVCDPGKAPIVGEEELAPPDCAVATVASAIECDPQHLRVTREPVFRHQRCHVRVMMLHTDQPEPALGGELASPEGAAIGRTQVRRHQLWTDREELLQVHRRAGQGALRLQILHVANVGGEKGVRVTRQTDRRLQFTAHRQQRAHGGREGYRIRCVSARPANRQLDPECHAHHRIISGSMDRPVVAQHAIHEVRQSLQRVAVGIRDRFVSTVSGGEDQRPRVHEEVVQRRVGEHHADRGLTWGNGGRESGLGTALQQHDWMRRRCEEVSLRRGNGGQLAGGRHVTHQYGQRLFGSALPLTQEPHGGVIVRATGYVKATDPLHRDHPACTKYRECSRQRRLTVMIEPSGGAVAPRQRRPALRAGVGLGMEAAIDRVGILCRAGRAHSKAGHRRRGTVIGQRRHDAVSRSTVGAVDERVPVPPVGGLVQLAKAVGTSRHISGDRGGVHRVAPAPDNDETGRAGNRQRGVVDGLDASERRGLDPQRLEEAGNRRGIAFHLDKDPVGVVANEAVQAESARQPVDERPETHPLHAATHTHRPPRDGGRRRGSAAHGGSLPIGDDHGNSNITL